MEEKTDYKKQQKERELELERLKKEVNQKVREKKGIEFDIIQKVQVIGACDDLVFGSADIKVLNTLISVLQEEGYNVKGIASKDTKDSKISTTTFPTCYIFGRSKVSIKYHGE